MLPVLVAARRALAARVAAMSATTPGLLATPTASSWATPSPSPPRLRVDAPCFASAAAAAAAPLAAPSSAPAAAAAPTLSAGARTSDHGPAAAIDPRRPAALSLEAQPRSRGRPRVERLWEPSSQQEQSPSAAAATASAPRGSSNSSNSSTTTPTTHPALAALRDRLAALGVDSTARDRVLAWTSPDTGYRPALTNPETIARRCEAFARRLGGRAASRVLSGNPNYLNLQDGRLDECLASLAEAVGQDASGELDDEEGEEGVEGAAGGEGDGGGGNNGARRRARRPEAASTATAASSAAAAATDPPALTPAEEAAVSLLTRNHYLLSHARGTLAPRARQALAAVRRVPGCASPPSRAARVLLSQPRLLSSARLAARCDFLAALEATDPHRPAMARRWAGLSPATVGLVLSHRSAALLRLLYLQRAPMRAAAALGASLTSAVTAPAAEFAAAHPGWAAWERALARLPQADVDRCLRELRPPPTLAAAGGAAAAAGGGAAAAAAAVGEGAAGSGGGGRTGVKRGVGKRRDASLSVEQPV